MHFGEPGGVLAKLLQTAAQTPVQTAPFQTHRATRNIALCCVCYRFQPYRPLRAATGVAGAVEEKGKQDFSLALRRKKYIRAFNIIMHLLLLLQEHCASACVYV